MTIEALHSAATGMSAMQQKLDVISNNLANMQTTAFKEDRTLFEDIFYRYEKMPGTQDSAGHLTPIGIMEGLGTRVSGVATDFSQGSLQTTGSQLDVAIQGQGFFQLTDPTSGNILYTRAGTFSVNADGQVAYSSANIGYLLQPSITIPQDAQQIVIGPDGKVSVLQANQTKMTQVGTIELATFINPQGLLKLGNNLYSNSDASGPPRPGNPGQNGTGTLVQASLEASNADPVVELVNLITTQRAFEMNGQVLNAADQMLQLIAGLRRQT
jgi:flagellar basal-body rod protein FlgG